MKKIDGRKGKSRAEAKKNHDLGDRFEDLLNEEIALFEGKIGISKIKFHEEERLRKIKQDKLEKREKARDALEYELYISNPFSIV